MEAVDSVGVSGAKRKAIHCEVTIADGGSRSKIRRMLQSSCDSSRSVIRNYQNFVESRLPRRVMFLEDGEWRDFPANLMASLVDTFSAKRSVVEISMRDGKYLIDFVHMVMIDRETGTQQSVGWIDEADKCVFPMVCCDGDDMPRTDNEINLKLEFQIGGVGNSEPEERKMISNPRLEEEEVSSQIKEVVAENGISIPNFFELEDFDGMLVRLESGGDDFNSVRKLFLTGLGASFMPNNVMCIHRYCPKGYIAQARLQSFEGQVKIMKALRGDANLRRGWLSSSKEGVAGILRHGFGRCRKPSVGVAYGSGIYFAPENCGHVRVNFCDVDENGVQHMVLCRIIMGSMEQIQPGSEQFHPSCEDFDSGVDDILNPRLYVVWSTHMNTHIHPEYVVSFKLNPSEREYVAGLKDIRGSVDAAAANHQRATAVVSPELFLQRTVGIQTIEDHTNPCVMVRDFKNSIPVSAHVKLPTSAWLPFSVLFDAIQSHISPSSKILLDQDYNNFKSKKITREQFIRKLRLIAGDELLKTTLRQFQCNPPPAAKCAQQMLMLKGPLN